jgi:phosphogluconate dehydratase
MTNKRVKEITDRIVARSSNTRSSYLSVIEGNFEGAIKRNKLSCGNLAHGFAGCETDDKTLIADGIQPNLAIITAYNDMLSAHKP